MGRRARRGAISTNDLYLYYTEQTSTRRNATEQQRYPAHSMERRFARDRPLNECGFSSTHPYAFAGRRVHQRVFRVVGQGLLLATSAPEHDTLTGKPRTAASTMDKLKGAVEKVKIINVVEKGSSTEAPSSVMVAVRCRPMNTREINQKESKIVVIKENGYAALQSEEDSMPPREFSFDYTYDEDSLQRTVYENLGAPLLDKAFGGWNGTIFAYGQTGAGKSFSMTGSKSMPGIIPQMNGEMFERIEASTAENPDKLFLVTCSFMEIYNEVLYDLLDPTMRRARGRTSRARTRTSTSRRTPSSASTSRACRRSTSTRRRRSRS